MTDRRLDDMVRFDALLSELERKIGGLRTLAGCSVIQCAARKQPDAGHLRDKDGRPVLFVADPANAPTDPDIVHARPDDISDQGITWREQLA
jgi:hypothetical protein